MLSNLNSRIKNISVIVILVLVTILLYGSVVFGEEPKELIVGDAQWSQKYPASYSDVAALKEKIEEINEQGKYKIQLVTTDAGGKREKFVADIEDLLVQQVDILILSAQSPHDYVGWKDLVEKQKKETGKPLVYACASKLPVDIDTETMGVDFAIATSDINCGKVIAQHMVGYLFCKYGEYKGNIVKLRGYPGTASDSGRDEGFSSVIDQYPDIVTVFEQTHHYSRMEAYQLAKTVLQKFEPGSIDAIFGYNDEGAMGTLQAAKEAGRVGEFLIYGVDGQSDLIRAVQEGDITGTAVYKQTSADCLVKAIDMIEGKSIQPINVVPDIFITTGNANTILGEVYTPFVVGEDVHWDWVNK
jgi:ribose transport system substrate-binding protein